MLGFIPLLSKYVLSLAYQSGAVQGPRNMAANKIVTVPKLMKVNVRMGESVIKYLPDV